MTDYNAQTEREEELGVHLEQLPNGLCCNCGQPDRFQGCYICVYGGRAWRIWDSTHTRVLATAYEDEAYTDIGSAASHLSGGSERISQAEPELHEWLDRQEGEPTESDMERAWDPLLYGSENRSANHSTRDSERDDRSRDCGDVLCSMDPLPSRISTVPSTPRQPRHRSQIPTRGLSPGLARSFGVSFPEESGHNGSN